MYDGYSVQEERPLKCPTALLNPETVTGLVVLHAERYVYTPMETHPRKEEPLIVA